MRRELYALWCRTNACAMLFAAVALPSQSHAWTSTGHRFIGELAVRDLPAALPDFVRSDDAAFMVGELSREPDRSRGAGSPHDADLDPGHYVDVSDDLTIAGGPSLLALPETREAYDAALRKAGSDEYKAGYLPYSIIDGWQQLVKDFAYWRADAAGARFAKTDAQRAWFVRDQALREEITIRDLGYWSHFVGDGSQPMHASVHYDGWGNYPNPNGYAATKGLHVKFEGMFVHAYIQEADVAAAVAPYAPSTAPIQARVSAYLAATQAKVIPLYELDKEHAFDSGTPEGKAFAVERLAAAVAELRDLVADAWNASATAKVGYPATSVGDIEAGRADVYAIVYGED